MGREIWKYVPKYGKRYQVSNLGRLRRGTQCYRGRKPFEILTIKVDPHGYPVVDLYEGQGKYKRTRVHRVVLMTFRGTPKPGQMSRHLNDIKTDNKLNNLRWGTKGENHKDFYRNGGIRGFNNPEVLKKAVKNRIRFYALRKLKTQK